MLYEYEKYTNNVLYMWPGLALVCHLNGRGEHYWEKYVLEKFYLNINNCMSNNLRFYFGWEYKNKFLLEITLNKQYV